MDMAEVLLLICIFVNGATDAANSITTAVACRAISLARASFMAALCNFAGLVVSSLLFYQVAVKIEELADFRSLGGSAFSAVLLSVIIWSAIAWTFGIPTSESHGLLAAIAGVVFASTGQFNFYEWKPVIEGLLFSVIFSLLSGYAASKIIYNINLKLNTAKIQISCAAVSAFMHGAQDGQKFLGLLLSLGVYKGTVFPAFLCSVAMSMGTLLGGNRIVKKVGTSLVTIDAKAGIASDIGSAVTLFVCSLFGYPVSTTHSKTCAVMGAAAGGKGTSVSRSVAGELIFAWAITFPLCFALGFLLVRLFDY